MKQAPSTIQAMPDDAILEAMHAMERAVHEHHGITSGAYLDKSPTYSAFFWELTIRGSLADDGHYLRLSLPERLNYRLPDRSEPAAPMPMPVAAQSALHSVIAERRRQDAKWGEQNHAPAVWMGILGEEFGELCHAVNETVFDNGEAEKRKGGYLNMRAEAVQVAAVAIAFVQMLDRNVGSEAVDL